MNLLRDISGWPDVFRQRHGRAPTDADMAFFNNIYELSLKHEERGYRDAAEGAEPLSTENFSKAAECVAAGKSAGHMEIAHWFAAHLYECYMIGYNGFRRRGT